MEDGRDIDGGAPPERQRASGEDSLLRATPTFVRLAAGAWVRGAEWTVSSSLRAAGRVSRAAVSGESPADLLDDARAELRDQARRLLGISDPGEPMGRDPERVHQDGGPPTAPLRRQGAELLARSADVEFEEDTHPAFSRILGQLTPDEARILRLLATEGAQAAIDVRTWRPLRVGDELVAPGLTMIGAESGCRHLDQMPAYLNNLQRLGLIWFSREPIDDLSRYQVLEAQPDSEEAMKHAGRARVIRRSIQLTPFGADFCETCLPLDTAEIDALDPVAVEAASKDPPPPAPPGDE